MKATGPLPSALLVAIGLGTLATLVLVHLEAALLLEVTHGCSRCLKVRGRKIAGTPGL